jgi:hypothetical protein
MSPGSCRAKTNLEPDRGQTGAGTNTKLELKLEPKHEMKSYKAYSDGQYLKKEDVSPAQVWTIKDVKEQTVTTPGKEPKTKLVLFFNETKKGLVLNISNGDVLYEMTGTDNPEEWIGTRVELYVDDSVTYAGKKVGGIRLRKPTDEP